MNLRGTEYGKIIGASGVQGVFGEGHGFHPLYKLLFPGGFDFTGMGFTAKTVPLNARQGNVKKGFWGTLLPRWIRVDFLNAGVLNAMGLPGEGIEAVLDTGQWQARTEPFMISVATVEDTRPKRLDEMRAMVDLLGSRKSQFASKWAMQMNFSCPNTGHDPRTLIGEWEEMLDIAAPLNVALVPKFSISSAPVKAVCLLGQHPACDAICVSNTWSGKDWQKMWGTKHSPLGKLGGGYSGAKLGPLVRQWIRDLRDAGFEKPINGGGGVLCKDDVTAYRDAGASCVFLGSGAILRPWRVQGIIAHANSLEWM